MHEQEARQLTGRRRELLNILPRLRRFALSLAGNADAADDLLQRTVEHVLNRGLQAESELLPTCIRVSRQLWLEASSAGELQQAAGSDCTRSATRTVERPEDRDGIHSALAALSGDQRAVLELVAVEGHSWQAAADMLDMPIGRVMNRLARARGALIEHCRAGGRVPLQWTSRP